MKNGFEGLLGGAAKNEELKNFVDELNTALERNPQSVLLQAIAALLKEDDQKMIDYEFNLRGINYRNLTYWEDNNPNDIDQIKSLLESINDEVDLDEKRAIVGNIIDLIE